MLATFEFVLSAPALVYARTESLGLGMLLHTSLTASSILITPVTSPAQMLVWNSLWPLALALVALVMALVMARRGKGARQLAAVH